MNFSINAYPDTGNSGSNKIEVFLPDEPREIMVRTDRGDDIDDQDEEHPVEDTALYYAVERIAELEAQLTKVTDTMSSDNLEAKRSVLSDFSNHCANLASNARENDFPVHADAVDDMASEALEWAKAGGDPIER